MAIQAAVITSYSTVVHFYFYFLLVSSYAMLLFIISMQIVHVITRKLREWLELSSSRIRDDAG
jgi:hypothetical protein